MWKVHIAATAKAERQSNKDEFTTSKCTAAPVMVVLAKYPGFMCVCG